MFWRTCRRRKEMQGGYCLMFVVEKLLMCANIVHECRMDCSAITIWLVSVFEVCLPIHSSHTVLFARRYLR